MAVSGPVTSGFGQLLRSVTGASGILRVHTCLDAIDGLVSTLGLVSLGHHRGDAADERSVRLSRGLWVRDERAASLANSRHDSVG